MKRTRQQREHDMMTVAQLYLQGWTQRQIAQQIGVSQQQIHKDLKKIRAEWMESAVRDFDRAKAEELAKIDHMEAEAWKAFEDSGRPGDPRYLDRVAWCIDRRIKIFGLDAPTKISPTVPDGSDALPGNVLFVMPDNGRDREARTPPPRLS